MEYSGCSNREGGGARNEEVESATQQTVGGDIMSLK